MSDIFNMSRYDLLDVDMLDEKDRIKVDEYFDDSVEGVLADRLWTAISYLFDYEKQARQSEGSNKLNAARQLNGYRDEVEILLSILVRSEKHHQKDHSKIMELADKAVAIRM